MNGMMVLVLAGMAVVSSLWADESKPFLLPVEGSGGRAVRYFAGHPLDQRDEKSEHAVVIVHGLNGGKRDGAERIRSILNGEAHRASGEQEKILGELAAMNIRTYSRMMELDKVLNQKVSRDKSIYNKD